MAGGGTLMAPSPSTDSETAPPTEKGGVYPTVSGDFIGFKPHLGINAEVAWRYHKAYDPVNGETYRPFLTDVNALYQRKLIKKFDVDLFAGIGVASTRFYLSNTPSCGVSGSGCTFYNSSNHFMEDLGGGVRYYFWRHLPHVFARPEVHYYHIQNNNNVNGGGFSNNSVFRVAATLGYTFGKD